MGAVGSSLATSGSGGLSGLGDVPENCIAAVLKHLDPPEICRLARVNRSFHRASLSDSVWENKLPCNYGLLVERVFGERLDVRGRLKEIFAKLCLPNRFDHDNKEMWLDQRCGKVFLVISAKALKITGVYDRRYWKHISTDESRFGFVFYLQQTWWLEVLGDLEFHFPNGTYSLFFRTLLGKPSRRFGRNKYTLDQVHGWDIKPVRFRLSTSDGQSAFSEYHLNQSGKWIMYHVGDFVVEDPNLPTQIKFSMLQIDCTHTKGGLCLDSVIIRPASPTEKYSG